jgi:hypothetical protein
MLLQASDTISILTSQSSFACITALLRDYKHARSDDDLHATSNTNLNTGYPYNHATATVSTLAPAVLKMLITLCHAAL